jgi:ferritin
VKEGKIMLQQEVKSLLNQQINKEFFSAYLYLAIADYYGQKNLNGFENWFLVQAKEEQDHAMLMRQYLINAGEEITLTALDAPRNEYDSFRAPLTEALAHEQYITKSIYTIYDQAQKAGDYKTMNFLNWFVTEQGEEEKNADDLIKRYDLFGGDSKGLYMLNADLATRVYSPPSLVL